MIDSHCHLADETYADDLPEVVRRARDAGLERVMVILEAGNDKEAAQGARVEQLWPRHAVRDRRPPASGPPVRRRSRVGRLAGADSADRHPGRACDRRNRPRLPLRLFPTRGAARGVPRAGQGRARNRSAGRDSHPRGRRRHRGHSARGRRGEDAAASCTVSPARRRWRERRSTSGFTSRSPASLRFRKPANCARRFGRCRSIAC